MLIALAMLKVGNTYHSLPVSCQCLLKIYFSIDLLLVLTLETGVIIVRLIICTVKLVYIYIPPIYGQHLSWISVIQVD